MKSHASKRTYLYFPLDTVSDETDYELLKSNLHLVNAVVTSPSTKKEREKETKLLVRPLLDFAGVIRSEPRRQRAQGYHKIHRK